MTGANDTLLRKARAILDACIAQGVTVATVESCTGGLLSATITELPGSSRMFTHGFVTYANEAKTEMVGVPAELIETHGAVSEQVARAMAEGGIKTSRATLAISITGIAGPDGGSAEKPVGTVHFALAMEGQATLHQHKVFQGDRNVIRMAAVDAALDMILTVLKK